MSSSDEQRNEESQQAEDLTQPEDLVLEEEEGQDIKGGGPTLPGALGSIESRKIYGHEGTAE